MSIEQKAADTEEKKMEEEAVEENPANLDQLIIDSLRALTADKKQEVLDFIEFLQQKKNKPKGPLRSPRGLWAGLGIEDISEEEFKQLRREMWGGVSSGEDA